LESLRPQTPEPDAPEATMTQSEPDIRTVAVFNFHIAEGHVENRHVAPFKATLARIKALGGEPLAGTEEAVAPDEIDPQGRYRRVATGWGELR
jgi:hypothetical protein